jgi:hypothetical protein
MVRSRMTLWARGIAVGSMAALAALISGCALEATGSEPDVDEAIAEASDQLDQGCPSDDVYGSEALPEWQWDPEPDPWRPQKTEDDDPTDPDDIRTQAPSATPGNHDEN